MNIFLLIFYIIPIIIGLIMFVNDIINKQHEDWGDVYLNIVFLICPIINLVYYWILHKYLKQFKIKRDD